MLLQQQPPNDQQSGCCQHRFKTRLENAACCNFSHSNCHTSKLSSPCTLRHTSSEEFGEGERCQLLPSLASPPPTPPTRHHPSFFILLVGGRCFSTHYNMLSLLPQMLSLASLTVSIQAQKRHRRLSVISNSNHCFKYNMIYDSKQS